MTPAIIHVSISLVQDVARSLNTFCNIIFYTFFHYYPNFTELLFCILQLFIFNFIFF